MEALGFNLQQEAWLKTLTADVLKSSEIEGEKLDEEQVRSSLARRLGMDIGVLKPADRHVEGVVEMMLDATRHYARPLTAERLFAWHASLFSTGRSGMTAIRVATWRDDCTGPMQVVSGPMGKEHVHYEAPKADRLGREMNSFLEWFEGGKSMAVRAMHSPNCDKEAGGIFLAPVRATHLDKRASGGLTTIPLVVNLRVGLLTPIP
jgi:Fic family protein